MTGRKSRITPAPAGVVPFTPETATAYLRDLGNSVKKWDRMRKAERVALIEQLNPQGWIFGGPDTWSKDEQINHLTREVYPRENEARKARYTTGGAQ